jgi:hypothetical protein
MVGVFLVMIWIALFLKESTINADKRIDAAGMMTSFQKHVKL